MYILRLYKYYYIFWSMGFSQIHNTLFPNEHIKRKYASSVVIVVRALYVATDGFGAKPMFIIPRPPRVLGSIVCTDMLYSAFKMLFFEMERHNKITILPTFSCIINKTKNLVYFSYFSTV